MVSHSKGIEVWMLMESRVIHSEHKLMQCEPFMAIANPICNKCTRPAIPIGNVQVYSN